MDENGNFQFIRVLYEREDGTLCVTTDAEEYAEWLASMGFVDEEEE